VLLCSCERFPDSYPPPEQRHPMDGPNPDPSTMVVNMSDPDAASHFVKDIQNVGGGSWRWTDQQPTLKIITFTTDQVSLKVDFTLWPVALQQTGPVELSFFVNQRLLDKVRYTTPGYKHFQKLVPPDWLTTDVESTVSITIDKMFVGPEDGVRFGFILSSVGFVQ
jgi:hypothetical protein